MSDARYDVSDGALGEGVTAPREQILEAAGGGRRFANFLIDYLCYMLLAAIIGVGVVLIWGVPALLL